MDSGRLEELFHAAAALPASEREEYLAHACGSDEPLRERLRALLARDAAGGLELLERGLHGGPPVRRIGRYTLLDVLGEGGMGTVYLARQDEPARLVALKTVRVGSGSSRVAERLALERDALALMDHPCIARVLDAGVTDSGLPYFAMEYVPGVPLDAWCERRRATLEERLALFLDVCAAVQHAHQKGIVHRDLKPSNVLVRERDGKARPKLIDFGIAQAVGGPLALDALEPGAVQTIGTLAYMSPEQADPRSHGVDTRSDVYALGVLLYGLLAGVPPFDAEEAAGLEPREALRRRFERDPPPPSRRLAGLDAAAARRIAEERGTRPRALVRRLAGDLDAIVLRAMARERTRRYPAVSELAADLEHYLRDEPVTAWDAPPRVRAAKFVRRHRASVGGLALLLAVGVLGLAGTTMAWRRAEAAGARAEAELHESEYQADKAEAYVEFVEYVLTLAAASPGEGSVRELLLRCAPEVPLLFRGRRAAEAGVHHVLGYSFLLMGDEEQALDQLLAAQRLREDLLPPDHPDVFSTLTLLVQVTRRLGRERASEEYADRALAMARRIFAREHPELEPEVARILGEEGDPTEGTAGELAAVDALLATADGPDQHARNQVLTRILIEAGLRSEVGAEAMARLEAKARELVGPESLRYQVFLWKLAVNALRPERRDFELALAFARRLREDAGRLLARDHWLVREADRLEGLALAGTWLASGDPDLVEECERLLWRACEAGPATAGPRGRDGFTDLPVVLGREGAARWLRASYPLWSRRAEAGAGSHGWWPATRPGLDDTTRREALGVLEGQRGDARAGRQRVFALARLGRAAEALEGLEGGAGPWVGLESARAAAFRALCALRLGRPEDARVLVSSLRAEQGRPAADCELEALLSELEAALR